MAPNIAVTVKTQNLMRDKCFLKSQVWELQETKRRSGFLSTQDEERLAQAQKLLKEIDMKAKDLKIAPKPVSQIERMMEATSEVKESA